MILDFARYGGLFLYEVCVQIVKRIRPAEMLPAFYGIAWRDWLRDEAICLPVPLNVLARLARAGWVWLRVGGLDVPLNSRDAYEQGLRDGATKH
jgi:hypothetical protein